MYICIYVHMYTCVCMYGWMDGWMDVCTYVCLRITHVCLYIGMRVSVCTMVVHIVIEPIRLGILHHAYLASRSKALRPPRSGRDSQVGGGAGIGLWLSGSRVLEFFGTTYALATRTCQRRSLCSSAHNYWVQGLGIQSFMSVSALTLGQSRRGTWFEVLSETTTSGIIESSTSEPNRESDQPKRDPRLLSHLRTHSFS